MSENTQNISTASPVKTAEQILAERRATNLANLAKAHEAKKRKREEAKANAASQKPAQTPLISKPVVAQTPIKNTYADLKPVKAKPPVKKARVEVPVKTHAPSLGSRFISGAGGIVQTVVTLALLSAVPIVAKTIAGSPVTNSGGATYLPTTSNKAVDGGGDGRFMGQSIFK